MCCSVEDCWRIASLCISSAMVVHSMEMTLKKNQNHEILKSGAAYQVQDNFISQLKVKKYDIDSFETYSYINRL